MKRQIAWMLALFSAFYLLVIGPLPDPIPIIDEATALLIFVKAMAYLGYDMRRWIPFLSRGKPCKASQSPCSASQTVDG
jgi:hypothetical protein